MIPELTARDKKFLIAGGLCVIIYCTYVFIAEPVYKKQALMGRQIQSKSLFLEKYKEILSKKDYYTQKEKAKNALGAQMQRQFLSETKPALAAASLQKILEDAAQQSSASIVTTRTEKPKYIERILAIPVEITVRASLKNLSQLIFQIENHEKFMLVEEISAKRVDNKKELEELNAKLLVNGFIQQLEPDKNKKS